MKEFFLIEPATSDILESLTREIDTKNTSEYIFHYKADFSNSKIIRDFVGAIFDAFNIPCLWRGRFILVTDELINNSIEHGSQSDDINRCIIRIENIKQNQFHISVEVHDTGNGEKIISMEEIKKDRTKNEENGEIYMGTRGRGLFHITEKIVDKLSFSQSDHGGLAVKIEKCIETSQNKNCEEAHSNQDNNKNE